MEALSKPSQENIATKFSKKKRWRISFNESRYDKVCYACLDRVIASPSYCFVSDFPFEIHRDMHKACAEELPGNIQNHPLHPHHILIPRFIETFFVCNGCSGISIGLKYSCKECKFQLDVPCVSKIKVKTPKKGEQTNSLYHRHKLLLVHSDPLKVFRHLSCCCCKKSYRNPSYTCTTCVNNRLNVHNFFIHKSCLDWIPKQVRCSFHPKHPLSIRSFRLPMFIDPPACGACSLPVNEIALNCKECRLYFHVICGSRARPGLLFDFHPHQMHYLVTDTNSRNVCMFCKDRNVGAVYKCLECNVIVHTNCIPIPEIVEHESHSYHPLKLTNSIVTDRETGEYRCDICEEAGYVEEHSFYCQECDFIAHIECVYPDIQDARVRNRNEAAEETEEKNNDMDGRNKGKAKLNISDDDDVEEISKYENDIRSTSEDEGSLDSSPDGAKLKEIEVRDDIINVKRKMEELVQRLEADAYLSERMQSFKAEMVALVLKLEETAAKSSQIAASGNRISADDYYEEMGFDRYRPRLISSLPRLRGE